MACATSNVHCDGVTEIEIERDRDKTKPSPMASTAGRAKPTLSMRSMWLHRPWATTFSL